jgi:hypothetical protein
MQRFLEFLEFVYQGCFDISDKFDLKRKVSQRDQELQ